LTVRMDRTAKEKKVNGKKREKGDQSPLETSTFTVAEAKKTDNPFIRKSGLIKVLRGTPSPRNKRSLKGKRSKTENDKFHSGRVERKIGK